MMMRRRTPILLLLLLSNTAAVAAVRRELQEQKDTTESQFLSALSSRNSILHPDLQLPETLILQHGQLAEEPSVGGSGSGADEATDRNGDRTGKGGGMTATGSEKGVKGGKGMEYGDDDYDDDDYDDDDYGEVTKGETGVDPPSGKNGSKTKGEKGGGTMKQSEKDSTGDDVDTGEEKKMGGKGMQKTGKGTGSKMKGGKGTSGDSGMQKKKAKRDKGKRKDKMQKGGDDGSDDYGVQRSLTLSPSAAPATAAPVPATSRDAPKSGSGKYVGML